MDNPEIKSIIDCISQCNTKEAISRLLVFAGKDWEQAPVLLKREKAFINIFGDVKRGKTINDCFDAILNIAPTKHRGKFKKLRTTIDPLNKALELIASNFMKSSFWQFDKEFCFSSILIRFERQVMSMKENSLRQLEKYAEKNGKVQLDGSAFIETDDGNLVPIDEVLQKYANSVNLCIRFIEHLIRLNPTVAVDKPMETFKAGSAEIAGLAWNSILYLVDRISYFDWKISDNNNNPKAYYFEPRNKTEYFYMKIGGRREEQWLLQQARDIERNFGKTAETGRSDALFPQYAEEARCLVEMIALCSDDRIVDAEFANGLKIKELARAWAVLERAAVEYQSRNRQFLLSPEETIEPAHLLLMSKDEILSLLLSEGKLSEEAAAKCLELLIYWNTDFDVFSSPIFPTKAKDTYLLLSSIFVAANPARSILRIFAFQQGELGFKGYSAEVEVEDLFNKLGFICKKGFEFKLNSADYDIDCLAYKGNTLFICECKSILPPESQLDEYRIVRLFSKKASNQALRGKKYVENNFKQIASLLDIGISQKDCNIVPVIFTNLFGFTGLVYNGVTVCDFSALARFTQSRTLNTYAYRKGEVVVAPQKELWDGEVPTDREVLQQIMMPFQLKYQAEKLQVTRETLNLSVDLLFEAYKVRAKE